MTDARITRIKAFVATATGAGVEVPSAEDIDAALARLLAMTREQQDAEFDVLIPGWRQWSHPGPG